MLKQKEVTIEQLQLRVNQLSHRKDENDSNDTINTALSEERKDNDIDTISSYNDKYWKLKIDTVRKDDLKTNELNDFKARMISILKSYKDDIDKKESKIRSLHGRINSLNQEKSKLEREKARSIKQKESEIKSLRSKNNEARAEITRVKQSVSKIESAASMEKDQIARKVEKLENDKKKLSEQLEREVFYNENFL